LKGCNAVIHFFARYYSRIDNRNNSIDISDFGIRASWTSLRIRVTGMYCNYQHQATGYANKDPIE
jgi:hypothetical protein